MQKENFSPTLFESPTSSTLVRKRSKSSFKNLFKSRNPSLSSIGESDALSRFSSPKSQATSVSEQTASTSTPATSFSFPSTPNSPKFLKDGATQATEEVDAELPRLLYRVTSRQQDSAESLQQSNGFMYRAVWIAKDREAYKTAVQNITRSNDLIESLLRCHVLRAIDRKLREGRGAAETKSTPQDSIPEEDMLCIGSLARLHKALPMLETDSGPLEFGLRLAFDHSLTKESILADFQDLPQQGESSIYLLQATSTGATKPKDSRFLLTEDFKASSSDMPYTVIPKACEPFEHLADLPSGSSLAQIVRLFEDTTPWAEVTTLDDLLSNAGVEPSIRNRMGLAALLAKSHMHLSELNDQSRSCEARNFRFFDVSPEVDSISPLDIVHDEDRLLSIYHFPDLGKRPAKSSTRAIGTKLNMKSTFDASIVDLGLLLYQVGCWKRLQAARGTGPTRNNDRLKEEAYENIHELYRKAGLRFAETVQSCLEWDHRLPQARLLNLARFHQEVVTPLLDLRTEIRMPNTLFVT